MSDYVFNYQFNITGDAASVAQQVTGSVTSMNSVLKQATNIWASFEGKIVAFNNLTQFVEGFSRTVDNTLAPGAALNASLADLSAVSGETGEGLKRIEQYARDAAKTFGGSAAQSVESYKLLLSQLSPELAKTPDALKAMGDNIAVLSKTMGGNATAAAEVLTTAMNQYGVSLDDPMEASREMAEMMNIMAAAGREGSAELPTIKMALEQSGMAAKAAGVSFAETNAAIQVLDKAGKKGAEGGVALRNVMAILATGRFLPKDVQEELTAAGVNISALTDKSKTLSERLNPLKSVLNDSALFTKLFGRENSNAAMALVQGIDEVNRYTEAISGTNTAFEQADIIMESYNEKQARIKARFDDLKISIFNATGDFGIWVETITGSLVPLAQLTPLLMGVGKVMTMVRGINFSGVLTGIARTAKIASLQLVFLNNDLRTGQFQSIGFLGNISRATVGLTRFATVGLFSGVRALGAWVLSLVTGGTASTTFAGIASGAFTTFKMSAVSACKAVGIAIKSIPIVGWIAAGIAGLIALGKYFYDTSESFRGFVWGLWDAVKTVFSGIGDYIGEVLGGVWHLIKGVFNPANWFDDSYNFSDGIDRLLNADKEFGEKIGKAFAEGRAAGIASFREEKAAERKQKNDEFNIVPDAFNLNTPDGSPSSRNTNAGGGAISGGLASIGGSADKADKIKNINVSIEKLIDKFEIHTTNLHDDVSRVKDMVAEALTGAVNDVNYAM